MSDRRQRTWRRLLWAVPVVVAVLGGLALPGLSVASKPASSTSAPSVDPAVLYQEHCASCHGVRGGGTTRAPSLRHVGAAAVDFYLSTGRMPKRAMESHKSPPYRPYFSPAQIAALVRYVTRMAAHGGPAVPHVDPGRGTVQVGGQLFRENCAACHGWGGTGGELSNRPVPAITEATPTQIAEAIRIGPSEMPKFGPDALTDKEVDAIAAYVASLKHPRNAGGDPLSHLGPVAEGTVVWVIGIVFLLGVIRWIGKRA